MESRQDSAGLSRVPCRAARSGLRARSRGWAAGLAGALCLAGTVGIAASPPPGQDIESVHAWLREHNPELRALALEAEAARARIEPAGALPDPSASLELRGLEPARPWRGAESGREIEYSVRQPFPLWGKRGLARSSARHEADAAALDRDATARELLSQAESAYVRYWHADQAVAVLERRIALLRQVEELAGARYALGMAAQQDSIRAQVEQTQMQRERIERLSAQRESIAMLNAALDRPADAPLAPPATEPALAVPPGADHSEPVTAHPAVLAQRARADAARTNAELQRRNRLPDVTVGVGAMQRGGELESTQVMFEIEIPLQQRARRAREREAGLLHEAALVRVQATQRALEARAATARAQWRSARERRELIERTLLPQADAVYQSALASYQVGDVDFGTLLEALDQWQSADLARVDALRDELLGAAAVRAIEGDMP